MSSSTPGESCRPHPYKKRPTLSNVSNQHIQPNYNQRYQDSYTPDYPLVHQVSTASVCGGTKLLLLNILFDQLLWTVMTCRFCNVLISFQSTVFQDPLSHLYEQQENLNTDTMAGFGQQVLFMNMKILFFFEADPKLRMLLFLPHCLLWKVVMFCLRSAALCLRIIAPWG